MGLVSCGQLYGNYQSSISIRVHHQLIVTAISEKTSCLTIRSSPFFAGHKYIISDRFADNLM